MEPTTAGALASTIVGNRKLLEEVYKDLLQPGVRNVGKSLGTVFDFCNTILFPLELLNEARKPLLKKALESFREKLKDIPINDIVEVQPELGVPILEKLTYVRSEELRNKYINLLASASIKDTTNNAHPIFINIINCMSVNEAKIIDYLSRKYAPDNRLIPCIKVCQRNKQNGQQHKALWNATGIEFEIDLTSDNSIDLCLENFISNGLLTKSFDLYISDIYSELKEKYQKTIDFYSNHFTEHGFNKTIVENEGFEITDLGLEFIKICCDNNEK